MTQAEGANAGVSRDDKNAGEIQNLIAQLGDNNPAAREQASKRLADLGSPALTAFREATRSKDPEVSKAPMTIIGDITNRAPKTGQRSPRRVESKSSGQLLISSATSLWPNSYPIGCFLPW